MLFMWSVAACMYLTPFLHFNRWAHHWRGSLGQGELNHIESISSVTQNFHEHHPRRWAWDCSSGPRFNTQFFHVRRKLHPGYKCHQPHYHGPCLSIRPYLDKNEVLLSILPSRCRWSERLKLRYIVPCTCNSVYAGKVKDPTQMVSLSIISSLVSSNLPERTALFIPTSRGILTCETKGTLDEEEFFSMS